MLKRIGAVGKTLVIDVTPDEKFTQSARNIEPGMRLTVLKRLSERLYLTYSRSLTTSTWVIRTGGETSRFWSNHVRAFVGEPSRSQAGGKSWLNVFTNRWRVSSRPGALGRPPGSICSPTRRLSRSSIDLT